MSTFMNSFILVAGALILLSGLHMDFRPAFRRHPDKAPRSTTLVRTWGFACIAVGAVTLISTFSQFVPE